MSYVIVGTSIVKKSRRPVDMSKPGLVKLLAMEFPKGQEDSALAYANKLAQCDGGADWDRNGEICRGVSNSFVINTIKDMVDDRRQHVEAVGSSKPVSKDGVQFAKAVQDVATSKLDETDKIANNLHQLGARGFLDKSTGELLPASEWKS